MHGKTHDAGWQKLESFLPLLRRERRCPAVRGAGQFGLLACISPFVKRSEDRRRMRLVVAAQKLAALTLTLQAAPTSPAV
jgi:hypothetical protein